MAKFKQEDRHWILQFDNGSETYLGHNNIPSKFDGAKVIPEEQDRKKLLANYQEKMGDAEVNISIEIPGDISEGLVDRLVNKLKSLKNESSQ